MKTNPLPQSAILPTCLLLVAVAAYRVIAATAMPELPNFSPVMALAFCGAFFLSGPTAWILPAGILFLSDIALSLALGYPPISAGSLAAWICVGLAVGSGRWLAARNFTRPAALFGGVAANSLLFYIVTNTASWLGNPAYAKNAAAWVQSLTVGLPGYPPTWVFFRNSLASDLLFTGLILALVMVSSRKPARAEHIAQATA